MIYASILAGGIGVRMHRMELPKQFLMLGAKPIIIHTVEQFIINSIIDKIFVVAPEDWVLYTEDLLKKWFPNNENIIVIRGGMNKTESVYKVVECISEKWGITDEDILVTHDAIRPFVTQRIINNSIEITKRYGAANTVMDTTDTIISSVDGEKISDIPPKRQMYAEQTPQTFQMKLLEIVFKKAKYDEVTKEFEIARLYKRYGYDLYLVKGEYSNMKIINPYDLEIANALLKETKK